jgi:hypothetical protein
MKIHTNKNCSLERGLFSELIGLDQPNKYVCTCEPDDFSDFPTFIFTIDGTQYELAPEDYLVVDDVNRAKGDCWADCEVTLRAKFFDTNKNWILGS